MRAKSVVVRLSMLVCALALGVMALGADQPGEQPDWRMLIVSSQGVERAQAEELVLQDRKATLSSLLQVLELPLEADEPFYSPATPRNTAIRVLGEWRAPEAVLAIAQRLMPISGQTTASTVATDLSPAGWALVKIGMPAVPAVMDILASAGVSSEDKGEYIHELIGGGGHTRRMGPPLEGSSPLGDQCLRILVLIKGLAETEAGLRREIAAETSDSRKKNLEDALAALGRPSLRQGLQNIRAQTEAREWSDWRGWWKREEEKQAKEKAPQPGG